MKQYEQQEAGAKQLNLYEVIIEDLLKRIKAQDFSYDLPFCTEKRLSETYHVSRITAKRAITELEQRGILYRKRGVGSFVAASADLSSATPPSKQALDLKSYALQLPFNVTMGGIIDTVQVISSFLNEHGYTLGTYMANKNATQEKASLKRLIKQHINGLIYYPITNQIYLDQLNDLVLEGKPVIILDKTTDCPYIHNITSNNFEGSRLLTEHLITLGHSSIVFLCNAPLDDTSSVRDRFGGFLFEMKKHGLNPGTNALISLNNSMGTEGSDWPELTPVIRQLHNSGVTAIEAENDAVAFAILRSCQTLGLQVPEDISICGFDNTMWSQNTTLGITTAAQDFRGIGEAAAHLLKQLMTEPNLAAQKIILPVSLVVRGSTGIPRCQ